MQTWFKVVPLTHATSACCSVELLTLMYARHTLAACERSAQTVTYAMHTVAACEHSAQTVMYATHTLAACVHSAQTALVPKLHLLVALLAPYLVASHSCSMQT